MTKFSIIAAVGAGLIAWSAHAQVADQPTEVTQDFAVHGQTTFTLQGTPSFASPYVGTNSLTPNQRKETFDATLFIGARGIVSAI